MVGEGGRRFSRAREKEGTAAECAKSCGREGGQVHLGDDDGDGEGMPFFSRKIRIGEMKCERVERVCIGLCIGIMIGEDGLVVARDEVSYRFSQGEWCERMPIPE